MRESKNQDMANLFICCSSLTSISDISNLETDNVTNMNIEKIELGIKLMLNNLLQNFSNTNLKKSYCPLFYVNFSCNIRINENNIRI